VAVDGDGGTSVTRALHRAGVGNGNRGSRERERRASHLDGRVRVFDLRLREGFALADFNARFEASFDEIFASRTARLFEGGLLEDRAGPHSVDRIAASNWPTRFRGVRLDGQLSSEPLRISTIRSG